MLDDINRRLTRVEDRCAIGELVVRYFLAADGDDFDTIGECFTEDSQFSTSGVQAARTRVGIAAFIRDSRRAMGLTVHTPHYVQCTFDEAGSATGLVGAHLEIVLTGVAVYGAVRYHDSYLHEQGRWRIHARDMRTIYLAPWNEVGQALASPGPVRWPGAGAAPSDFPRKRHGS